MTRMEPPTKKAKTVEHTHRRYMIIVLACLMIAIVFILLARLKPDNQDPGLNEQETQQINPKDDSLQKTDEAQKTRTVPNSQIKESVRFTGSGQ